MESFLAPDLSGLNPEQLEAVLTMDGPLAVIAGPGSGKTRVLTHRIVNIIATGRAEPRQILAVTFTNKAAGEMRERIDSMLGSEGGAGMWILTFHSFCARLLRFESEAAGLPRAFTILDTGDVRTVLRDVHREMGLPDDAAELRASAQSISRIKNGAATRQASLIGRIYDTYQGRLARLGALDFDDLLLRALELLQSNAEVLDRWQRRFRYVLVDEYQDTNPVQYAIVGLLAGRHRNLCVVGDADQAIYGFRAATPEALLSFAADWEDARTVFLGENYRSTPEILAVCQAVIDGNASSLRPRLRTTNPSGEPVRLVVTADDRDEARFVARELKSRLDERSAVLFRTNAQTRSVEDALMQEGVPYSLVGTVRFYERAEVKDALAYLKLVCNPKDVLALARAAGVPRRGLGPKSVMGLVDHADGGDLLVALREGLSANVFGRGRDGYQRLLDMLDAVRAAAESGGPVAAVAAVLDGGVVDFWRTSGDENVADRLENLAELRNAAREFEASYDESQFEDSPASLSDGSEMLVMLERFLERVALSSGEDSDDGSPAAVQLLTAHSSKGKEFANVYVMGVEEGLFPHSRGGEVVDEDEERRLMFVACSRAEKRLTLLRAESRLVHGSKVSNPPSRFLTDVESLCEEIDRRVGVPSSLGRASWDGSRADRWGRPGAGRSGGAAASSSWSSGSRSTGARSSGALSRVVRPEIVSASARPVSAPGPRLTEVSSGDLVRHGSFGDGVVIDVRGAGADAVVTIRFADGKSRQFKLDAAPLERR